MNVLTISKSLQGYHIYIKAFRQAYGLERKHLTILEV